MIMDDKAECRVADVEAKHFKAIIDALEEAAKEHEVGSQNAVYIAMCYGFKCAIEAMGRKKGVRAMREMLAYSEEIVTTSHDDYLQRN